MKAGSDLEVVLDARIDPGWHLYAITQEKGGPQPLVIALPPASPFRLAGNVIAPLPIAAPDANFNIETQYHAEEATFYVPLAVPAGASGRTPLDLDVTFQTCTERFCLPPATERVSLSLLVPGTGADAAFVARPAPAPGGPRAVVEDMADATAASTLMAYLGLAALMGALSLLTPCVFPMVPITVSYFTGRAERDRGRAVSQALVYGLGIVLTFTGAGALLAMSFGASGLNQFAANPWLNLGIAALFIAFALNLFGVFELALPASLLTRVSRAGAGRGRYGGTLAHGPGVYADVLHLYGAVSWHAARRRLAGRLAMAAGGIARLLLRLRAAVRRACVGSAGDRAAAAIGQLAAGGQGHDGAGRTGGGAEVPVERRSHLAVGAVHALRRHRALGRDWCPARALSGRCAEAWPRAEAFASGLATLDHRRRRRRG